MHVDRRTVLATAGLLGMSTGPAKAQVWGDPPTPAAGDPEAPPWPAQERIRLWPGQPPGAPARLPAFAPTMNGPRGRRELWLRGVAVPEVHVYRPAMPDGSAVLALPGGGYDFVSVENEGLSIAQQLTATGTTVFVLAYRLPGEGWSRRHLVPLQDAQRAMRLIRAQAAALAIQPDTLGIIGFSAGGHLAADLAVAHAENVYDPVDAADRLPARPAFAGLVYPVVDLRPRGGRSRSLDRLMGPSPSVEAVAARSPVAHVGRDTPPSFLLHAIDDPVVPLDHSLEWLAACRAAGVPVEAHLLTEGGHGFGGANLSPEMSGAGWLDGFARWMRRVVRS